MSVRERPLRVVQWATAVVGRHAVAAIAASSTEVVLALDADCVVYAAGA